MIAGSGRAVQRARAFPPVEGAQVAALNGINLTIKTGEFVAIMGPSRITSYNVCYTKLLRKEIIPGENVLCLENFKLAF